MSPLKEFYHRHTKPSNEVEFHSMDYIYDKYCEWLGSKKGIKKRPNVCNFTKNFNTLILDNDESTYHPYICTYSQLSMY